MNGLELAAQELEALTRDLRSQGASDVAERVQHALDLLRDPGELITTGQAAEQLGIRSTNTVKRWARQGLLEGFRRGGRVMVSQRSVQAMLAKPEIAREQSFEQELADVLDIFDAGDEPLPPSGMAHAGRKPWEQRARV